MEERPGFIPADTSLDAHRAQIQAYRRMGGPARLRAAWSLTDMARKLAMAGIRARHPEYDDGELLRAYARLTLGDDLVLRMWPGRALLKP